jgi:hypothetical protein
VEAYVFFTEKCIEALRMKEYADKAMMSHSESYDHIGEISGYIYDLLPVWERERERRRVLLSPDDAVIEESFDLPVSPPIAWDYLNDPNVRAIYMKADRVDTTKVNGRMTAGSKFHCAHGENSVDLLILDWQPFDYLTYESAFNMTKSLKVSVRFSVLFEERPDGTHVRFLVAKPTSPNPVAKIMSQFVWMAMKKEFAKGTDFTKQVILEAIEEKAHPEVPRIKIEAPIHVTA